MNKFALMLTTTALSACAGAPMVRSTDAALNALVEEYF